ncbi:hypothetical protein [Streptomyces sp. NPDC094032]|uniref:hypothetical protein n=1 Tax=Streptomyces sp. NPDC094032 TaxID=3155308 RepID=UPI00332FD7DD
MGRARRDAPTPVPAESGGASPAADPPVVELPGVRGQLRRIAADLASGLSCLWLVTDAAVDSGLADELYEAALAGTPLRIDVPAPDTTAAVAPVADPGTGTASAQADWWTDTDSLPYLELPDSGFDLDLGWSADLLPARVPGPRRERAHSRHNPQSLLGRLGKELSVGADQAVTRLVALERERRPLVGVRAWTETDTPAPEQTQPPGQGPRGTSVAHLFQSLAAEIKEAGLAPGERPRLLVVARLRDLPESLPDELGKAYGDTAVHWWWGTLGRLDTATFIAPLLDHRPAGASKGRDPSAERIRRAVRAETIVEVCGPDLDLARRLVQEWDGTQDTLEVVLERCLAAGPGSRPDCPRLDRVGALPRPGPDLRLAWAGDAIVSWEGRLRLHVASWHPAGDGGPAALPREESRTRLTALISQAQQRVLVPWIEEARQRVAVRALGHLTRPPWTVVSQYADRPPAILDTMPERAFLELQVGELLKAYRGGALALPTDDARLLRLLVTSRNVLAHRSVLYDRTLDELCAALSQADLRTP